GEEDPLAGALLGVHLEQVLALVNDFSGGDLVAFASGKNRGQRAFAGTVRAHDGVDFARAEGPVDAVDAFLVLHAGVEVLDGENGFGGHVLVPYHAVNHEWTR